MRIIFLVFGCLWFQTVRVNCNATPYLSIETALAIKARTEKLNFCPRKTALYHFLYAFLWFLKVLDICWNKDVVSCLFWSCFYARIKLINLFTFKNVTSRLSVFIVLFIVLTSVRHVMEHLLGFLFIFEQHVCWKKRVNFVHI